MKCLICYATTDIKNNQTTFHNAVISGVDKEDCYNQLVRSSYWNRSDYPEAVVNIMEL